MKDTSEVAPELYTFQHDPSTSQNLGALSLLELHQLQDSLLMRSEKLAQDISIIGGLIIERWKQL